ncbi:hypothetical protein J2X06_000022 [Lysobacter niastensis]|uniref:Uncharacterized protein n=1 Tax=Lysobacter niastensis TaxID=380629 RepID=A0ABU1W5H3_9GAMM|nr:hypothetical protein [Lysobacter niastensis]
MTAFIPPANSITLAFSITLGVGMFLLLRRYQFPVPPRGALIANVFGGIGALLPIALHNLHWVEDESGFLTATFFLGITGSLVAFNWRQSKSERS